VSLKKFTLILFFTIQIIISQSYCNISDSIFLPSNIILRNNETTDSECSTLNCDRPKRKWTILVYIAADNDLHYFAWNNIKQLAAGANENIYIIVQLNEPGRNKKTQRYLIEKNKAILLNKENQQKLDSGDPQTLIDFCIWSIKNFPAENYVLDLSNHGSGIIDRSAARLINPAELFVLNPSNLLLELDRSIEFLEFIEKPRKKRVYNEDIDDNVNDPKGVCFDETFQSYLTNQKLEYALKTICSEISLSQNIKNFKFSMFWVDACLMQMLELANLLKKYANILIASEEVELGPGWRYDKILKFLETPNINSIAFARHVVKAYEETYLGITNDFTLSAINLELIEKLENNVNAISEILIDMLQNQKDNSVKNIIKKCKSNVAFEEPSYIDLGGFYENLSKNLINFEFNKDQEYLIISLKNSLKEGLDIINEVVIENVAGSNITYAKGISVYFPEKRIHSSYHKTNFAQTNQWLTFLLHYIGL